RYAEAEQVARVVVNIYTDLGYLEDNRLIVGARVQLANTLNMQRRYEDALEIYRSVDRAVANWDPARRDAVVNSSMRVYAMLASGDVADSVEMAKKYYEIQKK